MADETTSLRSPLAKSNPATVRDGIERNHSIAVFKTKNSTLGVDREKLDSNYIKALKERADSGNIHALSQLGVCYLNGIGMAEDRKRAVDLFQAAVNSGGDGISYHNLGILHLKGSGVPLDKDKGIKMLEKACTFSFVGVDIIEQSLAFLYAEGTIAGQNEYKAFVYAFSSAKRGNTEAMFLLGTFYLKGLGTDKNLKDGMEWMEKAATIGDVDAQYYLGWLYESGEYGVQVDLSKAMKYYEMASGQNDSKAQYNLAMLLQGFDKFPTAVGLLRCASERDHVKAQFELSKCLLEGKGTKQNLVEAVHWAQLAANGKLASAQHALGRFYENGIGVDEDDEKAKQMYRLAADQGLPIALYDLGIMEASQGRYAAAKVFFDKALDLGFANAKEALAQLAQVSG